MKFLIGITPQGSISFISKGWGSRVSDLHLTLHCGLVENLIPGDLLLADRGFNIQEAIVQRLKSRLLQKVNHSLVEWKLTLHVN